MFTLNVDVSFGEDAFSRLPEMLNEYDIHQPGVLCDINVYNNSEYVRSQRHDRWKIIYSIRIMLSLELVERFIERVKLD